MSTLSELLRQYNPQWQGPFKYDLINRPRYAEVVAGLTERREITVLKGIRRCGKSCLLQLAVNRLLAGGTPGKNILFVNLEDYRLGESRSAATLDEIVQTYQKEMEPEGKVYLLLDEIQEIPGFEKWLRTHYDQNTQIKFIITGSSSSLFSRELASLLTGRQISVEVFPFSFPEFLEFQAPALLAEVSGKTIDSLYLSQTVRAVEPFLARYLEEGGFPEIVKNSDSAGNILALQQYITDILLRDVTQRYNIRKIDTLRKLAFFLIQNSGSPVNVTRLAELIGSNRTSVLDMLEYLREVYLIFTCSFFSFSPAEQLNTTRARKVFCIDNGFMTAIQSGNADLFSRRIHNCVFQHLLFHWGEQVFYWREKAEVDFVLSDGFAVSVAATEEISERRIQHLFYYLNRHNLPQGLLISWNKLQILEENERRVIILPLWIFLLKPREEVLEYSD